jgi:hypothetical protein
MQLRTLQAHALRHATTLHGHLVAIGREGGFASHGGLGRKGCQGGQRQLRVANQIERELDAIQAAVDTGGRRGTENAPCVR